ncbi:DUF4864 domain-containing protein [Rhodospirillales bacterium]|nr:DUF4864 domain-containing protein [Rhodospirillales bacterium]
MLQKFTFILVAVCITSTAAGRDLSRTAPHPSLSPLDVVQIVMNALQKNDEPSKNRGIAVTYNFTSPANKNVTGPIDRFVNMVTGPVYGKMVDHLGAVYEKIKLKGNSASIDVIIKVASGRFVGFRFLLTKQRDNEFEGTWMTDSVTPIEVISS